MSLLVIAACLLPPLLLCVVALASAPEIMRRRRAPRHRVTCEQELADHERWLAEMRAAKFSERHYQPTE